MSTTTTNYKLIKPELTDAANITATNKNWDIIDSKLKTVETSNTTTNTNLSDHTSNKSNPHGVTKSQVGLGNVGNFKAVSTVASQGLTDTEKANARANIGAGTSSLTIGTTASTAAAGNHTHKYAGSSSVGGSATSAVKLDSSAGSETQPVYFSNGKPVATTYTLGKSVPSDAKFTDTDTKVTAVGNHYTPSADSSAALSVDASSTTSASWASTSLVTGVNLQRDAKGHVTGVTVDSIRMPANPNSDTKVSQTLTSSDASYPLLLAPSGQTETATTTSYFDSGVTLNPSTNTISANVSGNAGSATKLATARTIRTNLGSTSATPFNGTANVTPGVTGTLPIANGGTGATTAEAARTNLGIADAIAEAMASGCKIATGSYVGTGTYGSDNPCSLTFDFLPKIVAIVGTRYNTGGGFYSTIPYKWNLNVCSPFFFTNSYVRNLGPTLSDTYTNSYAKRDGNTIYWYNTESTTNQINENNWEYYYVAIG